MKINTNSWHYHVYGYTYKYKEIPLTTNLCQYLRRIFFVAPFIAVLLTILYAAMFAIVMFGGILGLFIGYRPTLFWRADTPDLWVKYPLPKLFGCRVLPIYVIALALLVFAEYAWIHSVGYPVLYIEGLVSLGVVAFIAVFMMTMTEVFSDTLDLANEWFSAKKKGICPLVEFVDTTTKDINQ